MTDESTLLHRAQSGELRAWEELLDRYGSMVLSLARKMTGSATDAEDVVQEVFLRVYRGAAGFRGEAKLSSWIYRITINVSLAYRARERRSNVELRAGLNEEGMQESAGAESPETSAHAGLIRDRVERALRILSPRERAVFILRHYDDLPLKEIASALDVRVGTVKSLLFRAVEKLKLELAEYRSEA